MNGNPASNPSADPNQLFNTVGSLYKTTDGGDTWTELPTGFIRGLRVTAIAIKPDAPDTVYAAAMVLKNAGANDYDATQFGVLRSTDGGASWTSLVGGLPNAPGARAVQRLVLSSVAPFQLLARVDDNTGVYLLADGSATLQPTVRPSGLLPPNLLAFDPRDSSKAVGIDSFSGGFFRSSDSGLTWERVHTGQLGDNQPISMSHIVFSQQDSRVLYAPGSMGTVYKSTDGGDNWTRVLHADALPP